MSAKPIESGIDYVLPEDQQSVWITVGNISVYIKRNDEGVSVDLYPLDDENSDFLAGCWLTFAEAADSKAA
jgi:hypothetical protein